MNWSVSNFNVISVLFDESTIHALIAWYRVHCTVYTVVQWVQLVQLNKCSCYSDLMAAKSYAKIDKNLPINLKTKAKQVKKYTCLGHKKWNWVSQVLPWFKVDPFLKIDATLNNRLDLYVSDIEAICRKDMCLLIFLKLYFFY